MAENPLAGRPSAARGGVAVVLATGAAALSRLPHDTFLDGVVVSAVAAASPVAAWALWRLPRRRSIGG